MKPRTPGRARGGHAASSPRAWTTATLVGIARYDAAVREPRGRNWRTHDQRVRKTPDGRTGHARLILGQRGWTLLAEFMGRDGGPISLTAVEGAGRKKAGASTDRSPDHVALTPPKRRTGPSSGTGADGPFAALGHPLTVRPDSQPVPLQTTYGSVALVERVCGVDLRTALTRQCRSAVPACPVYATLHMPVGYAAPWPSSGTRSPVSSGGTAPL